WMYREPEAVDLLLEKISDIKVKITERLIDEVGVDGVRYGDDWGGESELMMGPDLWRKFIKPRQRLLYDACKEKTKLVMQHADGNIEEIISDLIEIGLDLLNPLQPECNDVEAVNQAYGDQISFHGTVSSRILDKGTPSEVRSEVKNRIDQLSTGGGYVLAPAHAYSYSEENIEAFRKAAVEYGRIPGKWAQESGQARGDIEL
ncbi:MAG: uroporphyrinogen decarboxylase family protein, partial [Candidatus Bipolaricaulia bacterium]